jgi:signal transduction histidine kinase
VRSIIHGEVQRSQNAMQAVTAEMRGSMRSSTRSPMEQLLHALNQPLTGLQCSMEVALAGVRTPEQYVQGLHEGLELTERMRALVDALREVVDGEKEKHDESETKTIDLKALLREVLDDLEPVAEMKRVRIELDWTAASSLAVQAGRQRLGTVVFRLVESALALADPGSALRIETGGSINGDGARIILRWHAESSRLAFSRAELGMLVAQAGWEQIGAHWEREQTDDMETVTVRLPRVSQNVLVNNRNP